MPNQFSFPRFTKKFALAIFSLATILAAGTLSAPAAIDLSDNSSFYDAENWYAYRSNTTVQFSSTETSITFSQLDSSSYVWGYFSPIELALGEKITISGTLNFGSITSGATFMLGIFNSGLCSESEMVTHTYQSGTVVSGMANYLKSDGTTTKGVTGTATGGMSGVSASPSKAYLRTKIDTDTAFLSTASGAQQTTTALTTAFTSPTAGTDYAFSLELLKTTDGIDFAVSFNGETAQTVLFTTDISQFDVLGIRSPGSSIVFGNISISTTGTIIPEPSFFGLFAGALALAFAGTRRCRRSRKNAKK